MFHDDLIKIDEGDEGVRKWHGLYHCLAGAVVEAHIKFLEVLKEVERCAQATGKDIHAVTVMLMYEFAESIDGVTILARTGAAQNCLPLLRKALEIGLGACPTIPHLWVSWPIDLRIASLIRLALYNVPR